MEDLKNEDEPLNPPVETNVLKESNRSFHAIENAETSENPLPNAEIPETSSERKNEKVVSDPPVPVNSNSRPESAKSAKNIENEPSPSNVEELVDNPQYLADSIEHLRRVRKDLNSNLSLDQLDNLIHKSVDEYNSGTKSIDSSQKVSADVSSQQAKLSSQIRDPPAPPTSSDVEHLKAIRRQVRLLFGHQTSEEENFEAPSDLSSHVNSSNPIENQNLRNISTRGKPLPPPPPGVRSPPRATESSPRELLDAEMNFLPRNQDVQPQIGVDPFKDLPSIQAIGPTPSYPTREMLDPFRARLGEFQADNENFSPVRYRASQQYDVSPKKSDPFTSAKLKTDASRNASRVSWAREVLQASLRPQNSWEWGGPTNSKTGNKNIANNSIGDSSGSKNSSSLVKEDALKILEDMELLFGFVDANKKSNTQSLSKNAQKNR
eukprot:GDKJ01023639.1.p1 GENE.GDKJ01023639.1~~GDKJ01023639.1.p1  ORF type:complete len:435 (+),score=116.02 GDKJ01023639.1:80-1384(+)